MSCTDIDLLVKLLQKKCLDINSHNTNLQKTSLSKLVDPFSVVLVCHVDIGQYASSGQYKAKHTSTTFVILSVFI